MGGTYVGQQEDAVNDFVIIYFETDRVTCWHDQRVAGRLDHLACAWIQLLVLELFVELEGGVN